MRNLFPFSLLSFSSKPPPKGDVSKVLFQSIVGGFKEVGPTRSHSKPKVMLKTMYICMYINHFVTAIHVQLFMPNTSKFCSLLHYIHLTTVAYISCIKLQRLKSADFIH